MIIKKHITFIKTAGYAKCMILAFNLAGVHDSCLGQRSERYHNRNTVDRIIYNLMPIEDLYRIGPGFLANPYADDVIRTFKKAGSSATNKIGFQYCRNSIFGWSSGKNLFPGNYRIVCIKPAKSQKKKR